MADKLYFSRDSKLYVELTSNKGKFQGIWEIPVLDGFSFSQATNQTEIGLQEMESTAGVSRRGRRLFTDSLSPAEWSFSTYMRPTEKATGEHHLVDEVLWAAMAGADVHHTTQQDGDTANTVEAADFYRNSGDAAKGTAGQADHGRVLQRDADAANSNFGTLTFQESNRATLPQITLYFVFETDTTNPMVYKLSSAIVNECSVDFDIDGIATANWSGFAKEVTDLTGSQLSFVTSTDPRTTANVSISQLTDAAAGVFTSTGHGLQNGQKVSFADSATGDSGDLDTLLRNKSFFVIESATNTFQLSATRGGTALDTTSLSGDYTGTAFTMTYTPPEVYLDNSSDFLLHVLDGSNYREAFNTGVTSTANFIRNRLTQLDVRGQNPDVMEGKRLAITGYSSGTFDCGTGNAHGLSAGDVVRINGLTGAAAATFNDKNLFVLSTGLTATAFKLATTAGGTALSGTVTLVNNPTVATGIYSFTLTGGNMTISNNVTYLVPEEIGTINKPIEGVTGARSIGGSFTCYLVFDDATGDTGSSSDFFSDLVAADKGLTKVVNDFDVTFKVGGNVATGPRVDLKFPKAHIDVPTHSIEDVISLETNFGAYTEDFDSVDEFTMDIYGVSVT